LLEMFNFIELALSYSKNVLLISTMLITMLIPPKNIPIVIKK